MPQYQPYAPTPSLPPPISSINLDTEQKLHTTAADRDLYASLAELHAILISLEFVEKAFVKDTIPAPVYTPTCARLLSQYAALLADPGVCAAFGDLESFKRMYGINCPSATRRIQLGPPASDDDMPSPPTPPPPQAVGKWPNTTPKLAAEATQNFITAMDALRLQFRAKDELHPLLARVIASVDAVTGGGGGGFEEHRKDVVKWLIRLNSMKAGEEISEEEGRECLWDLERGYNSFLEGLG